VQLYERGLATATIATTIRASKTTVLEDLDAAGVSRRPPGRQPESPLPDERTCEVCPKTFRPRRSQQLRGWGRFCSLECMAQDWKRRDASRASVTHLNLQRRLERDRVKTSGDLLETHEVADICGVTVMQVHEYVAKGLVEAKRVEIGGLPFLFFTRGSVETLVRGWRRSGHRMRHQWLDPEFVLAVYDARELTERMAERSGLSLEDARAVIRDRVTRRKKLFPPPSGRPKGTGPAQHHLEWLEMYLTKQAELERDHDELRDLDLLREGDRPPSKLDVALAVAEDDFSLHRERWQGYSPSRGDPHSLDPKLADSAARRIYGAIKPLLITVKKIHRP
jgi:hypothetical protein